MSKVIFVGNVPYDMTEEQLIDVFSSVGPVVGFRLVFDRDSGKAKGFGFCEFYDHETAMSAVRNLNGTDVKGRQLRIDLADSDPFLEGKTTTRGEIEGGAESREGYGSQPKLPFNIPAGVPVPPGSNALDVISKVIATMRPAQLMEVMGHMKLLVINSPDQARQLLQSQPQLSYALFQAMLMNRIVDPSVLQRMLAATNAAPKPPPIAPASSFPPPFAQQVPPPPLPTAPTTFTGYPPPQPPYYGAIPSQVPPSAPPSAPPSSAALDEQRKAMLMQVLSLTPAQIEALPPQERATIQQLRAQLGVP